MKGRHLVRLGIIGLCMLLAVAFGMPSLARAVPDNETDHVCVADIYTGGGSPSCVANDSALSLSSEGLGNPQYCKEGENVTASFIVSVTSAQPSRYDLGIYIALNGGSAVDGGDCYHTFWQTGVANGDSLIVGPPAQDSNLTNIDGDTCLDLPGSGTVGYKEVDNVSFLCQDSDNDDYADLNGCVGWRQNQQGNCTDLSGTGPGTSSKCDCGTFDTNIIVAKPAISVTKDPPTQTIASGADADFTITVTNSGNVPLTPVTIDDATCDSLDGPYSDAAMQNLVPSPGSATLAAGASWYYSCTVTGRESNFTNCVTANGTFTYPDQSTDNPSDEACADVTVGSLDIQKSADPTTYDHVGQIITYTYTLTNVSGSTLTNIAVHDDKTTDESCPQSSLTGYGSMQCTSHYTITQDDIDNGSVTNTAYASFNISGDGGPYDTPNSTATVTAIQNPALSLTKTPNPTHYQHVDDVINYTYTATNSGNVTLYPPFAVGDDTTGTPDCSGAPSSLAPGDHFTCTSSYTITQDDIDNKSVTNQASATATGPDRETPVVSDPVTATVRYGVPALAVPTMTDWGMIFFVFLAGLASIFYLRKRKKNI